MYLIDLIYLHITFHYIVSITNINSINNVILQQPGTRLAGVWHCRAIPLQLSHHFRCPGTSNSPSTRAALPWETFRPPRELFKACSNAEAVASKCIEALQGGAAEVNAINGGTKQRVSVERGDLIKHRRKERGEEKAACPVPSRSPRRCPRGIEGSRRCWRDCGNGMWVLGSGSECAQAPKPETEYQSNALGSIIIKTSWTGSKARLKRGSQHTVTPKGRRLCPAVQEQH